MLQLALPYPPSLNRYYRHVGRRVLISREGRAYRQQIVEILADSKVDCLTGPVVVRIDLRPPDRRRRDCDNTLKCLLDSLAHGGVYEDDSQIAHLEIDKREPFLGGLAIVEVGSLEEYESQQPRGTHELVCCRSCGRDVFRHVDDVRDAYCRCCLRHGSRQDFGGPLDRESLLLSA